MSTRLPITVRVLVRNLESDAKHLQFSTFFMQQISSFSDWKAACEFFPDAVRNEWMLTRTYNSVPPVAEDWSGFGAIPNEIEDLLLLLRLFRPGDLAFAAMQIATPTNVSRQFPYRVISPIISDGSSRPYVLRQNECLAWEHFADSVRANAQWHSRWFAVSRRFLLYGGGKEFNANFESDVDRAVDYVTALEAALVPESDFVSRRLRERVQRLLETRGKTDRSARKLISEVYGVRSTLVHGSPLDMVQMTLLRDNSKWRQFEELVREVLVGALGSVPSDESQRRAYLKSLYDITDAERAGQIRESYKAIKDPAMKSSLIEELKAGL